MLIAEEWFWYSKQSRGWRGKPHLLSCTIQRQTEAAQAALVKHMILDLSEPSDLSIDPPGSVFLVTLKCNEMLGNCSVLKIYIPFRPIHFRFEWGRVSNVNIPSLNKGGVEINLASVLKSCSHVCHFYKPPSDWADFRENCHRIQPATVSCSTEQRNAPSR